MTAPTRDSSTADIAKYAVDVASENLASDIALLDLHGVSDFTDYFVIASGETARHLESLAEDVSHALRDLGIHLHHREGRGQGGWILLDFPGIVVHLFTRQVRDRYGLERLWGRAAEILRVQ